MSNQSNFFQRAINALVEGRTRQAQRFVAQYQRDQAAYEGKMNKR